MHIFLRINNYTKPNKILFFYHKNITIIILITKKIVNIEKELLILEVIGFINIQGIGNLYHMCIFNSKKYI